MLSSGAALLPRIRHVLTEHSPGIFERSRDFSALEDAPSALAKLLAMGFAGVDHEGIRRPVSNGSCLPWGLQVWHTRAFMGL